MENIKVKTKFDFKALKVANLYVLRVKRKSFLIYSVLAAICIAAAVWFKNWICCRFCSYWSFINL